MSCETDIGAVLRDAGQKITPQRMLILTALRHREGHATAQDILADVKRTYPFIDVSTVYRTLSSIKDLHLVQELNVGVAEAEFEWVGRAEHHLHLVCSSCNGITPVPYRVVQDALARALAESQFTVADQDFALIGVCNVCKELNALNPAD